jgi:SAM-dependent methyltransferase
MIAPTMTGGRAGGVAIPGAIFLGAFLLFLAQPMIAKAILPRFGGAPAVWTTCLLFFQSLLLLGYAGAHASARLLRPRAQGALHLGLLALALVTLPIVPPPAGPATGSTRPVLELLALLARSVGLPCFVLCASSPLLQHWAGLTRGGGPAPYRLYALSNAGSMLALLGYPVAVEPWLTTRSQQHAWSWAFGGFALLSALCVLAVWRAAPPPAATAAAAGAAPPAPAPAVRQRLLWLALPACAVTLLLAVTNQMCQEVAVVPLLWVLPLALYLLSFILCFESDRWYSRSWCLPVLMLSLVVMAQALALGPRVGILYAVPVLSLGLFACCMFCHGELAARRPAARHLTAFYLMVALGGALGGGFVSLVAPLLFRGYDELWVGLLACGALAVAFTVRRPDRRRTAGPVWHPSQVGLVVVVGVIAVAFGTRLMNRTRPGLRELRSFHGTMRIEELRAPDGVGTVRYLTHGGTRHGQQFRDPARRRRPTTYFSASSGIGLLFEELAQAPPRRVGIIGLGAGVLAAWGRPGDVYRFYELDPLVIEVARQEFTFLDDSHARIELVPGDARLSLEREADQRFDVFVLDAFSSDAIPAHLLTVEAFDLYRRRLAPGGVLALHVTTRHLDLGPLIGGLAERMGLPAWEVLSAADEERGILDARWILITADRELLARPRLRAAGRLPGGGAPPPRLWTDDYSNLLSVLK